MAWYGTTQGTGRWAVGVGAFHIEADAVIAAFNSDDLQQTNVRSIPVELQFKLPNEVMLIWDTYFQRKLDTALASSGGVVHAENATKVRSRLTARVRF
jgi:hypothetical protein